MSLTGDENRNCEIFVDFKRSFNNASKLSSSSKIVTFPYGVGVSNDVLLFGSLNLYLAIVIAMSSISLSVNG